MLNLKVWFLAARPKTLFVSMAPVLLGWALACHYGVFNFLPAIICLVFALLAQITSNFINDYFDFVKGSDRDDRLGPERAVASGAISAERMLRVTVITMCAALLLGLSLVHYGGPCLIFVGAFVALFAFAYSGGPCPLSYLGLGDIAVLVFYGIVPVTFTYYVQGLNFPFKVIVSSIAVGLVGVNLLIVNNYRDVEADKISNKKTTVVRFGRKTMSAVYLSDCVVASLLGFLVSGTLWIVPSLLFMVVSVMLYKKLISLEGKALNGVLGLTSFNVLIYAVLLSITLIV
ncbi:MAG: 1,4-dihydroxy-2-naphthoate octaprenyltransferase [Bacteroidales bacterium]|nr:1,4-dihydroxy-2-naphthoate octaprenyltransferase [Bacteroidales bacterium]